MTDIVMETLEAVIYGYFAMVVLLLLLLAYEHLYDLLYLIGIITAFFVVMLALGFGIKWVIDE